MVTDKVYNKLDVLNQMVDAVKISEGLQQQIKTMRATPHTHDAGELTMAGESLFNKVET